MDDNDEMNIEQQQQQQQQDNDQMINDEVIMSTDNSPGLSFINSSNNALFGGTTDLFGTSNLEQSSPWNNTTSPFDNQEQQQDDDSVEFK